METHTPETIVAGKERAVLSPMQDGERLDLLLKLIERMDLSRNSIASRIAITMSAYSFILSGALVLFGQVLSSQSSHTVGEITVLTVCLGLTMLFTVYSLAYAAFGIASVRRLNRERFGPLPQRPFVHPGDTVGLFGNFEAFRSAFYLSDTSQLLESALAEHWAGLNAQWQRYRTLRRSVGLLVISAVLLTTAAVMLIVISFL